LKGEKQVPDPQLPAIQGPIKAFYKAHPQKAMQTMVAEGYLGSDVSFHIAAGGLSLRTGLADGAGGREGELCPGVLSLGSLAACAGVTMNAVASHMGIQFKSARIRAEGDIDLRGTLGVDASVPVGFKEIRLLVTLDTDAPAAKLGTLLEMTERYCVVYQSMNSGTKISLCRAGQ
jgi:uncharacterized OsmC-like protein